MFNTGRSHRRMAYLRSLSAEQITENCRDFRAVTDAYELREIFTQPGIIVTVLHRWHHHDVRPDEGDDHQRESSLRKFDTTSSLVSQSKNWY